MTHPINPSKHTGPMDNIPPVSSHEKEGSSFKAHQDPQNNFAQKYWHFDADEAKKFISTLCNTITNEIKHIDEKVKEANQKLKESEEGNDS